MKLISYQLLTVCMLSLVLSNAQAQLKSSQTASEQTRRSATQYSPTDDVKNKAAQWQLQPEEWQRYQELMDGPLGIYSPGIDPLTALGISARNDQERQRYAELQVVAESQRVERELKYQRAYDAAFKRLYAHLLPVDFGNSSSPQMSPLTTVSERLAVFVEDNCVTCDTQVKQLQQAEQPFDLYFVGAKDDETIRRWATKVGVDPQKVFNRYITLNHDSGRWESLKLSGNLPAVVKEIDGKWQRQ